MKGLSKEKFWNSLRDIYPEAVDHFCKWVDKYKEEVEWNSLFVPGIKFHDLPYDMQNGIIARFDLECFNGKAKTVDIQEHEPERIQGLFQDLQRAILKRQIKLN